MIFIFPDRENVEKISFTVSEKSREFSLSLQSEKVGELSRFSLSGKIYYYKQYFCRGRGSPTESILNNDAHEEVQT